LFAPPTSCRPVGDIVHGGADYADGPKGYCLLLHGLTGSPLEMQPLVSRLGSAGFYCFAPLLPGHCTSIQDLSRTPLSAWQTAVRQAFERIRDVRTSATRSITVIGLSLGSLLAWWLSRELPGEIDRLILLSPPLRLRSSRDEVLHRVLGLVPDCLLPILGSRSKSPRPIGYLLEAHNAYPRHSIAAAERTLRLRDDLIRKLTTPHGASVWIALDPHDHLVEPKESAALARKAFPQSHIEYLPNGQHELPLGPQREYLLELLERWLLRDLASPGCK
jgi:carboxylesterase